MYSVLTRSDLSKLPSRQSQNRPAHGCLKRWDPDTAISPAGAAMQPIVRDAFSAGSLLTIENKVKKFPQDN